MSVFQKNIDYDSVYRQYADDCYTCGVGILSHKRDQGRNQINVIQKSYCFCYILSGQLRYTDWTGKTALLQAGHVFQRIPDVVHSTVIASDDVVEAFMELDKSFYYLMKQNHFAFTEFPHFFAGLKHDYIQQIVLLRERLRMAALSDIPAIQTRMIRLMTDIYSSTRKTHPTDMRYKNEIDLAIKKADGNLTEIRQWGDLADLSGLPRDVFRKAFRKIIGQSPGAFLIQRKIEQACSLLKTRKYSIKEIAYILQYPDVYSFSKQFKKIIGIPPSRF